MGGTWKSSPPTRQKHRLQAAMSGLYPQYDIQRGLPITHLVKYFEAGGTQLARKGSITVHDQLPGTRPALSIAVPGPI